MEQSGELDAATLADATCFLGEWLQNPGSPIRTSEPGPSAPIEPWYPDGLPESERPHYDHFLNIYSHTVNLLHFRLPQHPLACLPAHRSDRGNLVALRSGELLISLRGAPSRSHQWEEQVFVHFERGRLELHAPTPLNRQKVAEVMIARDADGASGEQTLYPPVEWAFYRQAKEFVDAVAGGPPPAASGRACVADVALLEQISFKTIGQD